MGVLSLRQPDSGIIRIINEDKKEKRMKFEKVIIRQRFFWGALVLGMTMLVSCQSSAEKVTSKPAEAPVAVVQAEPAELTIEQAEKNIRKVIADLPIDEVRTTPMKGLYELRVGGKFYYADGMGKNIIVNGFLFDTATRENLTNTRLEEINTIDWNILPLDKAIVSGDPNGKAIAVFTDPDCPYCRKLEEQLKEVSGVKVYTFLFPIDSLHPNSKAKSDSIWCAEDRHQALLEVMIDNKTLPAAECETPVKELQALGNSLAITGTPTMIAGDGRKFAGFKKAEDIQAWALQ